MSLKFNEHQAEDSDNKYLLMTDIGNPLFYVAQSGLLGAGLPNHKSTFVASQKSFQMSSDTLFVPLIYETPEVRVKKIFEFNRGSYLIKTTFEVQNKTKNILNLQLIINLYMMVYQAKALQ